jgi:RNA polymerase sigma-70 factor, ECF subfamily
MTTRPPRDLDSDDQLLARTAGGDAQAFAQLFNRRHGQVYRFALHMTGIPAVAEDVTQDVFMVAMRSAAQYRAGRSGVAAWLCGIARNCARQRFDRDRCFQPLDEDDDAGRQDIAGQGDPLGDLTRAEGIERVRKAVLSLPVRYREVVVLCDLQELSYAEAADALACAVGTVRSRLHRGRQLLADKLSAGTTTATLNEDEKPGATATSAEPAPTPASSKVPEPSRLRAAAKLDAAKLRGTRSWA